METETREVHLNMRKEFCNVRVAEQWSRVPTEAEEILKLSLDTILSKVLQSTLFERGDRTRSPSGSSGSASLEVKWSLPISAIL